MTTDIVRSCGSTAGADRWTERERELLGVTLRLLQQHGFDKLTVEAVAAEAKSSKATIYRRWPSKADLVLAAFIEGTQVEVSHPRTGSLRGDLLVIGAGVCEQARRHGSTIAAIMTEVAHSPALSAAMQDEFICQRQLLIAEILADAVDRGEIESADIVEDLWDVLPGYLVFRSTLSGRPPTQETVAALVDHVLLPGLTRTRRRG